jgi:UDP-N-acetylglucosamine acyltransferase
MATPNVHPTAIIDKQVELDSTVKVGPYSVIRGRVQIGRGSVVESHVVIGSEFGGVTLGAENHIFSGAVIGGPPQDLKYKGEPTQLVVGDKNTIREFVTLNIGTQTGGGITRLGNYNLLMAYVHVAHDCQIGNNIVIANSSNFAGHVTVEDHVRIGGICSFNQFIRIGKFSFIAGDSAVNKDIIPFSIAQGKYAVSRAANEIGMERAGFPKPEIEAVYKAIRLLTKGERTVDESIKEMQEKLMPSENVQYLIDFIKKSERGIAR